MKLIANSYCYVLDRHEVEVRKEGAPPRVVSLTNDRLSFIVGEKGDPLALGDRMYEVPDQPIRSCRF